MKRNKFVFWAGVAALVILYAAACVLFGGCLKTLNPATGQTQIGLDPNSRIVAGAETAVGIAGAALPLAGPAGALIGGILLGALGAWKKVKPSLTIAKAKAEQYHAAASATIRGIEEFKKENPQAWTQLGALIEPQLKKVGLTPLEVENVIRAIRGLPPKA